MFLVKTMQVIPAIDLRGGRCVRLRQGDFDQETVFGDDPTAMAARWESEGARGFTWSISTGPRPGGRSTSRPSNGSSSESRFPVNSAGAARPGDDRHLAGCRASTAWSSAPRPCATRTGSAGWPKLIRAGWSWGWTRSTAGWPPRAGSMFRACRHSTLARQFDALPLAGIIYTDIARDGTLEGPNLQAIAAMAAAVRTPVIASGGVGELTDLERLATLPIAGCIVGRALYEGRFSLADAIRRSAATRSAGPPGSR